MAKQKNIGRKKYHIKSKIMVREIDPNSIVLSKSKGILIGSMNKRHRAVAHIGLRYSDYSETYIEI